MNKKNCICFILLFITFILILLFIYKLNNKQNEYFVQNNDVDLYY